MKNYLFFLLISAVLLSSCNPNKSITLVFTNPTDFPRENEVIALTYGEVEELIGPFKQDQWPLFISGPDTLTTQFIDYRGDALPEEILLEISLSENESKEINVLWVDESQYPEFPRKTSIHFARLGDPSEDLDTATRVQTVKTEQTSVIYQMEGPGWENDKVGFRNYFDLRNGMDIFGKKTPALLLMNVGLNNPSGVSQNFDFTGSYHEPADWGMDILKVGNSLGAGAIALETGDSLYRIGDNGKGTYKKLYEGPLRSEFIFSFPEWEAAGKVRNISQYISITANQYCYKSTLSLADDEPDATFITGVVNMHSHELIRTEPGNDHLAFITLDKQAEDGNYLGMAIMVERDQFIAWDQTSGLASSISDAQGNITDTYYVKLKTEPGHPSQYRFYAFWETTDPGFKDLETIKSILEHDALVIENPLVIAEK